MSKGVKQIAWYAKKQNNPIKIIRILSRIIRHCCLMGGKAQSGVVPWCMWAPFMTLPLEMFERMYILKIDKRPLDMLLSELKGCYGATIFQKFYA